MHARTSIARTPISRLLAAATVTAAFGLAAVTVTAASAASAASPRAARTAATPACAASGIDVWLNTQGNGTAGSIVYNLELTNLSGKTCTLKGFPAVSGLDLEHKALGSPASHNTSSPPALVTLAKGANAHALLQIVIVQNFPASSCHPVTAAGLGVVVPGGSASAFVPFPFGACSKTGDRYLSIGSIEKGLGAS